MIRPAREPLQERVEVDETHVGGARPGKPGRGAAGKTVVVGAVEAKPGKGRKRPLGRLRLQAIPDSSAASLEGCIAADTAKPLTVTTAGWAGYRGLETEGYGHEPINLSRSLRGLLAAPASQIRSMASWPSMGDASRRLPAIHLVFSTVRGRGDPAPHGAAKRWLLGTHHGAVRRKHLQRYLDEFVFRFNRRTAKAVSHGFARLIQHAAKTPPTTYRGIVHGTAA
jgi:transposase-like protein